MKIAFKLLLWVLVTGVILFPALLLILFVIGLSVVVSGAMAISAVGLVLGIYHAIYENFRAGRRRGRHLLSAWGFGFETYFHEDLQAYLADQILAQHGPEMAESFVVDERHSYSIAY